MIKLLALGLLFLVAAGFAVFGLVVFIRGRMRKKNPAETVNADAIAEPPTTCGALSHEPSSTAGDGRAAPRSASAPNQTQGVLMDRMLIRGLLVTAITLALLIPLFFVENIVDDRVSMRRIAVQDIASSWGEAQRIAGPMLVIPYLNKYTYTEEVKGPDGKISSVVKEGISREYRGVLPTKVAFDAKMTSKIRYRSIYEYIVYSAPVGTSGVFRLPLAGTFGENATRVEWDKAWLALGVRDLKGITGETELIWNGTACPPYDPGTQLQNLLGPGFHTSVPLAPKDAGQERTFSLSVTLNGSDGLHFTPVGESTTITVSGNWPHPKFSGDLLPASSTINDQGFSAQWSIPHLSRTYPQSGILGEAEYKLTDMSIVNFTAGVNLFETVSLYSQVTRAVKYGILFIGLTFVALFSFELVIQRRMHLMQYALVGLSMTVFYLVLLSLAEHVTFLTAFVSASAVTVLMNSLYIAAALRSINKGLVVGVLLCALYTLLYTLLRMEAYALIIGTGMVLTALASLMYLTRNLPTLPVSAKEPGK